MRFLLTRPEIESGKLGRKLSDIGHSVVIDPLMSVKHIPVTNCDLNQYQALVFTSINGVRSFHNQFGALEKSIYVVGNKTANVAKTLGYTDIQSADSDAEKLVELLKNTLSPNDGSLLYLSANDVSHDLSELLSESPLKVDRRIIYDIIPAQTLRQISITALEKHTIDYIPFYSRRSALIFIDMINNNNLQNCLSSVTALCLSSNVAEVLNQTNWKRVMTAENPRESDLFNLIALTL